MIITWRKSTSLHKLLRSLTIWRLQLRLQFVVPDKTDYFIKNVQQYSRSSDCYCYLHKLGIHWIIHWKTVLVSTYRSETKEKFQRRSTKCRLWCVADNGRLRVTTMKPINFQNNIASILIDNCKDHYVLLFDFSSPQDATENCHNPELVRPSLKLELNFTFPPQHVTEFVVLGERMLQLTNLAQLEENSKEIWLLCSKKSIASFFWSVGTLGHFPSIMFQLFPMRLLRL